MKKMTIPSSVPVFIQDLESQNGKYSKAKLKVFYIGETPDHRLFSRDFAEQVVQTLPLTPVVGYYDEDEEDFIGHNKTQYVYGLVPETAEFAFETQEDGTEWLVTDVILYTGRNDNIGEVAKKIVGKQHSLELNPDTLKYKINRDATGHFKNIEFQQGEFVGLSVLGDSETPAFTNSGFFTADTEFQNFVAECHQNFDRFLTYLNKNGGNIQVMEFNFNQFLDKVAEAAKLTMQEFQEKIYRWLDNNGVFGCLVENTEDYAIICVYEENGCNLYKYAIENNDGELSLGNREQVFVRYVTQDELNAETFVKKDGEEDKLKDDNNPEDDAGKNQPESPSNDDEDKDDDDDDKDKKPEFTDAADENPTIVSEGVSDATQIQGVQEETSVNQVGKTTTSFSASALTDSERLELEEFRKQAKISAINEYKGDVDDATIAKYIAEVDNYSMDELHNELNRIFRIQAKQKLAQQPADNSMAVTAFQIISKGADHYNENDPADVIKKYKNN